MEQPFYIGQKVVALTTDESTAFRKKGLVYEILQLSKCPGCGTWSVDIGEYVGFGFDRCSCGHMTRTIVWWHYANNFAPLQEGFEAITFERVMEEEKVSVN